MVSPIDPTATASLLAENRNMPMHVGALELFKKPEGAGRNYVREMVEAMRDVDEVAPLFLKHPYRSPRTAGQLVWRPDEQFDIEHHVRHSALPKPGRVRELLELCSRLHSTRLAWDRPLWEAHVIEGLRDGRVAMYIKTHHALVDGKPRTLSLKEMLQEFIRHRFTVVRRRTQFLLARARKRRHTVQGLLLAHANIDEVIRVIRASTTQAEAKERLMAIKTPAAMLE